MEAAEFTLEPEEDLDVLFFGVRRKKLERS
jgi:hypothetical protein